MRTAGFRFLSGPNIHDDASGVVIATDVLSLPPAGQPIELAGERCDAVFAVLSLAGMAGAWTATAARGRAGLADFLLRLASALVTPKSIFPSGGHVLGGAGPQLRVFLRCEQESTGLLAWDCACKAVLACRPGEDGMAAFAAAHAKFRTAAEQLAAGPTTAAFAREARRLDLPWQRLAAPGQFVQIGQGCHRHYLLDSDSDTTGAVAQRIALDKMLANRLLRAAGIPVLPMVEVASEAGAIRAAESIGYPVVVKPCRGRHGRGVGVHLADPAAVAAAFRRAAADGDSVVVEKFATGADHRVLVAAGRIVAAARIQPAATTDATDAIHPDNRAMLERAAAVLDLGIAGIDVVIDDIARPWREAGGVVLELNSFASLQPHWLAHPGRNVVEPIIRALLPPGGDGRIPTCAITGSLGKTTTANMVARILGAMGLRVGRCTTAGVTVGEERRQTGDCAGGRSAGDLLLDRRVEAGVFELARGGLLNEGMGIADVDVGAVLNIYDNHIGADGIASRADLARIKSIVARRARRMVVLNAEDPLCLAMREGARAERVCLVARNEAAPALATHVAAGGCAVTLRPSAGGDMILLVDRGAVSEVIPAAAIPATLGGQHGGKLWNALFAAAIAHGMGASPDQIRSGLRSFKPDVADSQGRCSIIDRHPFRVMLDYGTGGEAIGELANAVRRMPVAGRRLVCMVASGRSSDDLIRTTGRALAGAFDHYVCTNWARRPRPDPKTVPNLLRDGILAGGVPAGQVACIDDEETALHHVLGIARAGDVVVINTGEIERAIALVEGFRPTRSAAPRR